mmetsp:Transcript_57757/g.161067  ORF Transcript_57757/g.161067 Transcript_57757/m.161067 type:complete len:251 (+) Transcript_57757:241-993(+)
MVQIDEAAATSARLLARSSPSWMMRAAVASFGTSNAFRARTVVTTNAAIMAGSLPPPSLARRTCSPASATARRPVALACINVSRACARSTSLSGSVRGSKTTCNAAARRPSALACNKVSLACDRSSKGSPSHLTSMVPNSVALPSASARRPSELARMRTSRACVRRRYTSSFSVGVRDCSSTPSRRLRITSSACSRRPSRLACKSALRTRKRSACTESRVARDVVGAGGGSDHCACSDPKALAKRPSRFA